MSRKKSPDTYYLSPNEAKLLHQAIRDSFDIAGNDPYKSAAAKALGFASSDKAVESLAKQMRRLTSQSETAAKERRGLTITLRRMLEIALGAERLKSILGYNSPHFDTDSQSPTPKASVGPRKHDALKEKGLYEECATLAKSLAEESEARGNLLECAVWLSHAASDLRLLGRLRLAMQAGESAAIALKAHIAQHGSNSAERTLALKIDFGLTIARTTMLRGLFARGLSEHRYHENTARQIAADYPGTPIAKNAMPYVLHSKRQQAECKRYVGRYEEALEDSQALLDLYSTYDVQPRFWAQLYIADNLRLLGRVRESSANLANLQDEAQNRHIPLGVASALWRRATLEPILDGVSDPKLTVKLEHQLSEQLDNSRWARSYAHLVLATRYLAFPDKTQEHLKRFEEVSKATSEERRLEYAYLQMARGEMFRSTFNFRRAGACYEAARELFDIMEIPWGQVRSRVGLSITGKKVERGNWNPERLQGLDLIVWSRCVNGEEFAQGYLCFNLP